MPGGIIGKVMERLQRHSLTPGHAKEANMMGKLDSGRAVQLGAAEEARVQKHNSAASLPVHRTSRSQLSSIKTGEPRTRQRKVSAPDGSAAQAANAITIGKNRSVSVPDSAYQNEERLLLKHELEIERDISAEISADLMARASHSERDLSTNLRDNYDSILTDWQPNTSPEKLSVAPKAVVKPDGLKGGEHPDVLDGIMPPTSQRSLPRHDWQRRASSPSPERAGDLEQRIETSHAKNANSTSAPSNEVDREIDSLVREIFDHKGIPASSKSAIDVEIDQLLKEVDSEMAREPEATELDQWLKKAEESLVNKPPELERELDKALEKVEDELKPRRVLPRQHRSRPQEILSPERHGTVGRARPTTTSPKTPGK